MNQVNQIRSKDIHTAIRTYIDFLLFRPYESIIICLGVPIKYTRNDICFLYVYSSRAGYISAEATGRSIGLLFRHYTYRLEQ